MDAQSRATMLEQMGAMSDEEKAAFLAAAVGMDAETAQAFMQSLGEMTEEEKAQFIAAAVL